VLTAHRDLALEHKVRVDAPQFGPSVLAHADPGQLRTVLNCLVKNAIEAAGATGWVAARLEREGSELLHVLIEDSGSGPDRRQRDHLFEPFYSGREAGRGHGLGLPIAWRLAREQGCSVRFVPLPHGPTRFVLTLPLLHAPDPITPPSSNGRVNYQTSESL
jgi:signal transduction histidine kinase